MISLSDVSGTDVIVAAAVAPQRRGSKQPLEGGSGGYVEQYHLQSNGKWYDNPCPCQEKTKTNPAPVSRSLHLRGVMFLIIKVEDKVGIFSSDFGNLIVLHPEVHMPLLL